MLNLIRMANFNYELLCSSKVSAAIQQLWFHSKVLLCLTRVLRCSSAPCSLGWGQQGHPSMCHPHLAWGNTTLSIFLQWWLARRAPYGHLQAWHVQTPPFATSPLIWMNISTHSQRSVISLQLSAPQFTKARIIFGACFLYALTVKGKGGIKWDYNK